MESIERVKTLITSLPLLSIIDFISTCLSFLRNWHLFGMSYYTNPSRRRGLRCSAFKLGADLIDPALYSSLCGGLPCATLDSWCMNQQQMHQVISRDIQTQTNRQTGTSRTLKSAHGKGTESSSIAVIDGTTGLEGFEVYNSDGDKSNSKYNDDYDNTMNEITERMTSDVCRMLHAPFIEIVDCLHRKQIDSLSSPNTKFAIFNKGSQKSEIQREPRSSSRVKEEEDQYYINVQAYFVTFPNDLGHDE